MAKSKTRSSRRTRKSSLGERLVEEVHKQGQRLRRIEKHIKRPATKRRSLADELFGGDGEE